MLVFNRGKGIAKFLFITHGHTDHSGQLPTFVAGLQVNRIKPPLIYVPNEVKDLFQDYMDASYHMKRSNRSLKSTYKVTGASQDDIVDLNKNGMYVKVYTLYHNVPTRGYGIGQKTHKLKPQYIGKQGSEIASMRKKGIKITSIVDKKIFAYVCDTNICVFNKQPELLTYKYVMVECTFFCDESLEVMGEHIHWTELLPVIKSNPNTTFILIHFSMRYTWGEIEKFFAKNKMANVIVWMN